MFGRGLTFSYSEIMVVSMKSSNVTPIRSVDAHLVDAWNKIKSCLTTVLVLNDVNGKPLQRTSKSMYKALFDLFAAIENYDQLKEEK